MSDLNQWFQKVNEIVERFEQSQCGQLEKAGVLLGHSLKDGGMFYVFGTGHSHILAEEAFYRAGGLARVSPILDTALMLHEGAAKSSELERLEGYAAQLMDCYPCREGDVILIASNSGRNAVPIEMAMEARKRGMKVIALTNLRQSKKSTSRHSGGKNLWEYADINLDNCGEEGDCALMLEGIGKTAPTSTIIGAIAIHAVTTAAIEWMQKAGSLPEVFCSANVDGGEEKNKQLLAKYRHHIKSL